MEPYRDFKASMTCLFRVMILEYQYVPVILGKYGKVTYFIKTRAITKLVILSSSMILKGLTIQCLNF